MAFSVSRNNLEGSIPQTGQLSTFENNSYEGNPGLCGRPLSKKCEEVEAVPSSEETDENSNSVLDDFTWKPVVIGYGCGTSIGILLGTIIRSKNEE